MIRKEKRCKDVPLIFGILLMKGKERVGEAECRGPVKKPGTKSSDRAIFIRSCHDLNSSPKHGEKSTRKI